MKKSMSTVIVLVIVALLQLPLAADSLFTQQVSKAGTLVTEKTSRYQPGDIITVLVREVIDARTRSETSTTKDSQLSAAAPAAGNPFLVAPQPNGNNILNAGELPNWNITGANETQNDGETRRRNTLTTSITCTVMKSLPNGNLRIEGQKQVTVNREDSTVLLSGIIRAKDITPENTVQSTQVAEVNVRVKGKGPLWNNQRRGLVTKFLDWFTPF